MSSDGFGSHMQRAFDFSDIPWDQIQKWTRRVLLGLLAAIALFLIVSMVYRIEASDEGVLLRFGKHVDTVQPGLHWKLPWPIEKVYKVPVHRIQTLEFGFQTKQPGRVTQRAATTQGDRAVAEMLTGDLNLGHVEWIVQYRIKDPVKFLFRVGSTEPIVGQAARAEGGSEVNPAVPDTIRDVSESVMRKLVGDSSIDAVLLVGRDEIAKKAKVLLQQELDEFEAGVDIVTVKLLTTSPPTSKVQDAFQEVERAKQKKETVRNEALGERNSIIPAAKGAKDKAIAEAEGYKNRVVLETKGKTHAFLAQLTEYENAKDVTRMRLYLEAMEEILGAVGNKTVVDESIRGMLPLLNLDNTAPPSPFRRGTKR